MRSVTPLHCWTGLGLLHSKEEGQRTEAGRDAAKALGRRPFERSWPEPTLKASSSEPLNGGVEREVQKVATHAWGVRMSN